MSVQGEFDEKYYVLDNAKISKLLPKFTGLDLVDFLYILD